MQFEILHKRLNAAALALLVAACGAPPARNPVPAAPRVAPSIPVPSTPVAPYRVDSSHSELRLLVYRAGVMSALGHDHVIVNRALTGWVTPASSLSGASFSLTVPASGFVIDEAAARREEGADFSEEIGEDAKAGTLHNMLSPAVLDAQSHPAITVQSVSVEQAPGGAQATVRVSVAGHESGLVVPFTVDVSPDRVRAQAAFTVQQTALGLTPFSIMLGALRVEDQVHVKLDLVAARD